MTSVRHFRLYLNRYICFALHCYLVFKEQILHEVIEPSKLNRQSVSHTKKCVPLNILRKEVIQPHLPIRLPCYDFTPIICPTLGGWLLAVTPPTSGVTNSRGVTGGVYKARERIHRGMLIRDY